MAWNLSNKNESSALLKSGMGKTSGWTWADLSKSGKWLVKKYGGALAGNAAQTSAKKTTASKKSTGKKTTAASKKTTTSKKSTGKKTTAASKTTTSKKSTDKKTTTTSKKTTAKSSSGKTSAKTVKATSKYAKATVQATGSWFDGQRYYTQYKLTVKNKSKKKISGWKVKVKFQNAVQKSSEWNGKFTFRNNSITVKPVSYNKKIAAKKSVTDIGFIVSAAVPDNAVISVKIREWKLETKIKRERRCPRGSAFCIVNLDRAKNQASGESECQKSQDI